MTNDPNSPSPPEAYESAKSRIRRRRSSQFNVPTDAKGRSDLLHALARRAYPSYELFVFAILSGAVLGLGYVLDSQALLLFGVLIAPLMTPWVGLLLAAITGSVRYFFETLMALLISSVLVFLTGLLSGFGVRAFLPRTLNEAFVHSRLWWPDLVILAVGAILLAVSFVRSEQRPYLPSLMLAYEFFLPLEAAGFGLGSGVGDIWPHALLVFFVYFAWAGLFGFGTLIALRFLPNNLEGFALSAGLAFAIVLTLIVLMTGGNWTRPSTPQPTAVVPPPTLTSNLPPISAASSQPRPSSTPMIETVTPGPPTPVPLTLEITLPPTETSTITMTIEPTPVYARIISKQGGGAYLRKTPNGKYLATLDNYTFVQVLPETQELSGTTWQHVIAVKFGIRYDGWVLQAVLEVSTPPPNWLPSETPVFTPTP